MKGIIIYKGRYGATKQYADWLAEELKLPLSSADKVHNGISNYDFLVIGSSVYIGKLEIRKWLKKHLGPISKKKVFFFQVSGTPPHETAKLESYLLTGIPKAMREQIQVFFLPGKLNIKKLSWIDRFLLRMGARLNKDPKVKSEMLTEYNHVKKENLANLIEHVRSFLR
jgi:menaquinone-dependent protoporphyrinogen IX oxidase